MPITAHAAVAGPRRDSVAPLVTVTRGANPLDARVAGEHTCHADRHLARIRDRWSLQRSPISRSRRVGGGKPAQECRTGRSIRRSRRPERITAAVGIECARCVRRAQQHFATFSQRSRAQGHVSPQIVDFGEGAAVGASAAASCSRASARAGLSGEPRRLARARTSGFRRSAWCVVSSAARANAAVGRRMRAARACAVGHRARASATASSGPTQASLQVPGAAGPPRPRGNASATARWRRRRQPGSRSSRSPSAPAGGGTRMRPVVEFAADRSSRPAPVRRRRMPTRRGLCGHGQVTVGDRGDQQRALCGLGVKRCGRRTPPTTASGTATGSLRAGSGQPASAIPRDSSSKRKRIAGGRAVQRRDRLGVRRRPWPCRSTSLPPPGPARQFQPGQIRVSARRRRAGAGAISAIGSATRRRATNARFRADAGSSRCASSMQHQQRAVFGESAQQAQRRRPRPRTAPAPDRCAASARRPAHRAAGREMRSSSPSAGSSS